MDMQEMLNKVNELDHDVHVTDENLRGLDLKIQIQKNYIGWFIVMVLVLGCVSFCLYQMIDTANDTNADQENQIKLLTDQFSASHNIHEEELQALKRRLDRALGTQQGGRGAEPLKGPSGPEPKGVPELHIEPGVYTLPDKSA